jgi:hypothetical protein
LLSYERLSKKPKLFKSFTGHTLQKFDNIYNEEITKRYENTRLGVYQKERIESDLSVQVDHSN